MGNRSRYGARSKREASKRSLRFTGENQQKVDRIHEHQAKFDELTHLTCEEISDRARCCACDPTEQCEAHKVGQSLFSR